MKTKDGYLAIAVLAFGLIYTMAAWNLPRAPVGNPFGPIYFPLGLGLLVSVIGLLMLIQSFRPGQQEEHKTTWKRGDYAIRVLITVSLCVGYALMFNRLGFLISTFAFLSVFLIFLNGLKKWLLSASVAFLYTVGVWYLFEKIFLINLP